MGKQGESGENIEKHWKTGRIRGKYRKTLKNRAISQRKAWENRKNQGKQKKMRKHEESGENIEKHGKRRRIKGKHRET